VYYSATTKLPLSLVIFDRDGTLIEDTGYPINPAGVIWRPGALKAIAWLRSQRVIVVVATNQSGVSRGYFTPEQVHAFPTAMDATIQAKGRLKNTFVICPYLIGGTVADYANSCNCRKRKS